MTSPTEPQREPITKRLTRSLSGTGRGRVSDPEARFTRNVSLGFVVLIVAVALIIVVGLGYGLWESNFKPLASVDGAEVSRPDWEDRQRLEAFRLDRAEIAVRSALQSGAIDEDLANRRMVEISSLRESSPSLSMDALVDLIFQGQLAEARGITLSEDELAAALAADGTFPETRRADALVLRSAEAEAGRPSTPEGLAEARLRAEEVLAALEAGTSAADLVDEYSPATAEVDGDLGYRTLEDYRQIDPGWAEALFALDVGGITEITQTQADELLIGVVTEIAPEESDPGFLTAVNEEVGEDVHRHHVGMETTAAKLREEITAEAVEAEYDQVELAEILIAGNPLIAPEDDEGEIRASHILYQPEPADPESTEEVAADDPAWDDAQALAEQAAAELRAVEEVDARVEAFADRARADSDGPTGAAGGDLGFFSRADMVPEFSAPLFDAEDPQHGDIFGPVRSDFGWHVIMYDEPRAPIAERLDAVQTALAEDGADFAAVAAEYSDGLDAADGGATGWHKVEDLDEITALALSAIAVGEHTEAIDGTSGWQIYQKIDEATRPLEPEAAAREGQSAFRDWYDDLRFNAEDEGRISIDDSVYETDPQPQVPIQLPMGEHDG